MTPEEFAEEISRTLNLNCFYQQRIANFLALTLKEKILRNPSEILKIVGEKAKIGLIGGGTVSKQLLMEETLKKNIWCVFDKNKENCICGKSFPEITYCQHLDEEAVKNCDVLILTIRDSFSETILKKAYKKIHNRVLTLSDIAKHLESTDLPVGGNTIIAISDAPYDGIKNALKLIGARLFYWINADPFTQSKFSDDETCTFADLMTMYKIIKKAKKAVFIQPATAIHSRPDYRKFTKEIFIILNFLMSFCEKKIFWFYDDLENDVYSNFFNLVNITRKSDGIIQKNHPKPIKEIMRYFGIKKPMLHFPRYPSYLEKLKPKLDWKDDFYIVYVSFIIPGKTTSYGILDLIKNVVENNIYFVIFIHPNHRKIIEGSFKKLGILSNKYLVLREWIPEREKLIYEISQYHAGWDVKNAYEYLWLRTGRHRLSKNFMEFMHISAGGIISRATLDYIQAGLPFFTTPYRYLSVKMFEDIAIPLYNFETKHIRKIIKLTRWDTLYEKVKKLRYKLSLEGNMNRLKKFIFKTLDYNGELTSLLNIRDLNR